MVRTNGIPRYTVNMRAKKISDIRAAEILKDEVQRLKKERNLARAKVREIRSKGDKPPKFLERYITDTTSTIDNLELIYNALYSTFTKARRMQIVLNHEGINAAAVLQAMDKEMGDYNKYKPTYQSNSGPRNHKLQNQLEIIDRKSNKDDAINEIKLEILDNLDEEPGDTTWKGLEELLDVTDSDRHNSAKYVRLKAIQTELNKIIGEQKDKYK